MRYLAELFVASILKLVFILAVSTVGMYAYFFSVNYLVGLLPIADQYHFPATIIGMVLIPISLLAVYMFDIIRDSTLTRSEKWDKLFGVNKY